MNSTHEIRADYDRDTITVYQAYGAQIAQPALAAKTFVPPFSFTRMTWIKPSFLWLMERSGWGQKSNQEYILAIRIKRSAWENALNQAVLTSYKPRVYADKGDWADQFKQAKIHVQWDPERSLRGAKLEHRSIQVGVSRHVITEYVEDWIVEIKDYSPLVKKIHGFRKAGQWDKAKKILPKERIYPLPESIQRKLGM